jgi:hypothetical protein
MTACAEGVPSLVTLKGQRHEVKVNLITHDLGVFHCGDEPGEYPGLYSVHGALRYAHHFAHVPLREPTPVTLGSEALPESACQCCGVPGLNHAPDLATVSGWAGA